MTGRKIHNEDTNFYKFKLIEIFISPKKVMRQEQTALIILFFTWDSIANDCALCAKSITLLS